MQRVVVPKVDLQSQSAQIMSWKVAVGDRVAEGDVIAEVTTDKATIDIVSPCDGYVAAHQGEIGDDVAVGSVIAQIAQSENEAKEWREKSTAIEAMPVSDSGAENTDRPDIPRRIRSSPAARRLSARHGVTIEEVLAWCQHDPVNEDDVNAYLSRVDPGSAGEPAQGVGSPYAVEDMSSVRKAVARKMVESAKAIPHIYLMDDVDVGEITEAAKRGSASEKNRWAPRFTDLLLYAVVKALVKRPRLNCHVVGGLDELEVRVFEDVNLGFAVATEYGLTVPVIHRANHLSLRELSEMKEQLLQKARDRRLSPQEVSGSTVTVTNLGSLGVRRFMPLINPPEGLIVGVGSRKTVPVVAAGRVTSEQVVSICLGIDHRARDGADGAVFLSELKRRVEHADWID